MQPSELSNIIKERASELGFSFAGISNTEPLIEEGERLKTWLNNGYNAGMKWFERSVDKRINPSSVLPDSKSIIVLGLIYYNNVEHINSSSTGKISKYALGKDYHEVMNEKLLALASFLKSLHPDSNFLCYADTGPVMERELAQRAGLGWIGKNANLINKKNGSFFFLGCIFSDVEMKYDTPETNYCGTCTRCIDTCPTQAIIRPHTIDSNKCISYLTIEFKGEEIPNEFKGKFDQWIFGCDVCQDVCPWNRFAKPTTEPSFIPSINPNIQLDDFLHISEDEFKVKFKDSPIKRAKYKGIVRNIKFLLGK